MCNPYEPNVALQRDQDNPLKKKFLVYSIYGTSGTANLAICYECKEKGEQYPEATAAIRSTADSCLLYQNRLVRMIE